MELLAREWALVVPVETTVLLVLRAEVALVAREWRKLGLVVREQRQDLAERR